MCKGINTLKAKIHPNDVKCRQVVASRGPEAEVEIWRAQRDLVISDRGGDIQFVVSLLLEGYISALPHVSRSLLWLSPH